MIPTNLDKETIMLFEQFAKDEPKLNTFDSSVAFYDPKTFEYKQTKTSYTRPEEDKSSFFSRFGM